jgi:hypothetical protein
MIELSFFNNLIEFIDELTELLKEDWQKFKIFFKENKNSIIWLFISLITLQFTNFMSLGTSFNIYLKKNNIQQRGGNGTVPAPVPEPVSETIKTTNLPLPANAPKGPKTKDEQIANEKKKILDKKADKKKAKEEKKAKKNKGVGEDSDVKDIDKKLGIFNKLKGKISDSAGQHGMMGPVFSNLDGVMRAFEGIIALVTFILIIVGIISLPIFIFLIITYCIIKFILGKLVLI